MRLKTIERPAVQSSCFVPSSELSQVADVEDKRAARHLGRSIAVSVRSFESCVNVHVSFWERCVSSRCFVNVVLLGAAASRHKDTVHLLKL